MRPALAENELLADAVAEPWCIRCPAEAKVEFAAAVVDPCWIRTALDEKDDDAAAVADPSR